MKGTVLVVVCIESGLGQLAKGALDASETEIVGS